MQSDSISLCAIQSQDNAGVRISGKRLSVCLNLLDGQYQCEYTRVGRWALVCGVHRSLTVLEIGSFQSDACAGCRGPVCQPEPRHALSELI